MLMKYWSGLMFIFSTAADIQNGSVIVGLHGKPITGKGGFELYLFGGSRTCNFTETFLRDLKSVFLEKKSEVLD